MARLLRKLGQDPGISYQGVRDHFFNQLYQQISYSEIKDSAFDVAELVFALEGVLVCDPEAVNEAVLERSMKVIRHAQDINPNWRPLRPFRTNPQGGVQAPVSIEVALSLLRVVDLTDRYRPTTRSFASNRGVFRRYTEWLRSTRVAGKVRNGETFRGWQSEHAYSTKPMMHLWETSQVLLYLFNYRTLLGRHLAASALEAAGFSIAAPQHATGEPSGIWRTWEQGEPLAGLDPTSPYRIYASIRRSYVDPHAQAAASGPTPRARYSFLLYGPPGTGKTSVAEKLAASLRWRLLTITTSDFVILGEAQIEARAKAIFEVLQLQTDCVVLFDEIDRLLLDRDSIDYQAQGDFFQLMTPSMLTKLNDLRRLKRVIFIISTNYADRIDSAITRPGRIDAHYLLPPPNLRQRTRILYRRLSKSSTLGTVGRSDRRAVAMRTALYSWTELQRVVERAEELTTERGLTGPEALKAACFDVQPTIKLSTYIKRVNDAKPGPPDRLLEELFVLSYLEAEVKPSPDLSNVDLGTLKSHWADRRALVRDGQIREKLDAFLR
jgi:cytidylate kinase